MKRLLTAGDIAGTPYLVIRPALSVDLHHFSLGSYPPTSIPYH